MPDQCYRVKPKPTVETVTLYGGSGRMDIWVLDADSPQDFTHTITFNTVDGEPDCASIKMERIND
jgi:hypothetical protein